MMSSQGRGLARRVAGLRRIEGGAPSIALVFHALGERSIPLVLIVLGLMAAIPSPGIPAGPIFGSLIALVTIQTLIMGRGIGLPRRVADRPVPKSLILGVVRRGVPWLRRAERLIRPRLSWATTRRATMIVGAVILFQSLLIILPIPFGNTLPGLAIFVLALGLAGKDGAFVLLGHLAALGASIYCGLLVVASGAIIGAVV